jgi:glycosyltransferase involved in cell wall biosynthesis
VVLWAKLYEKELKELGVEKIKFYGADLYITNGEHVGYAQQLNLLMKKLKPELVSFEGNKEPQEIFSNIDCLIHYSLEPEPFGRVIIEAFNYKVPTISTGMGGAAELLINNITGIKTNKYDKHHLFESVKKIITDNGFRQNITENAFNKSVEIEKNIDLNMHQVLQEVAV